MMPHALTDNEIGRPKFVEPCGAEGYSSGYGRRERQLYRRRLIRDAGFRPSQWPILALAHTALGLPDPRRAHRAKI